MSAREYPVALTYEEINAVQGALKSLDAEYGLSGSFYTRPPIHDGATVEDHRSAFGGASNEAAAKAEALLAKISALAENAAQLEPNKEES